MSAYLDGHGTHLRDKHQRASLTMYALGLLSDGERKSMEPIAAHQGDRIKTCVKSIA